MAEQYLSFLLLFCNIFNFNMHNEAVLKFFCGAFPTLVSVFNVSNLKNVK